VRDRAPWNTVAWARRAHQRPRQRRSRRADTSESRCILGDVSAQPACGRWRVRVQLPLIKGPARKTAVGCRQVERSRTLLPATPPFAPAHRAPQCGSCSCLYTADFGPTTRYKAHVERRCYAVPARLLTRRNWLAVSGWHLEDEPADSGAAGDRLSADRPGRRRATDDRVEDQARARRSQAMRTNVTRMRVAASTVPRTVPDTFEVPPARRRCATGTSRIRRPAAAARICISRFQP